MTLIDPPQAAADFHRDRWGRPLVIPAGETKPVPYTRSSSAAKTIEDTYNLELWARRNIVFGLSRDASLVARALAVGGDPTSWDQPTKQLVNKIAEDAATVAQAHKGADIGTALHTLTERLDLGEAVIGGPYQADLDAYRAALVAAGLTSTHVECRMVCDALKLAGTADRIVSDRVGLCYIADIKTGPSVDFGGLGWAAQLAAYAYGSLYDPTDDSRPLTPPLHRQVGYIIHLPAGQGRCEIHAIDLAAGYEAAVLANRVRATRTEAKRWIRPLAIVAPPVALSPAEQHAAIDMLDGDGHPTEGPTVPPEGPTELQRHYEALSADRRLWISTIAGQATRARRTFTLSARHTIRRFEILRGLVLLAEVGICDDQVVRQLLVDVFACDAPLYPAVTTGEALGALGEVCAAEFALAADSLVTAHHQQAAA